MFLDRLFGQAGDALLLVDQTQHTIATLDREAVRRLLMGEERAKSLAERRWEEADRAFENYDFDDMVDGTGGWEWNEPDRTERSVFLAQTGGPSAKIRFHVRFRPHSTRVVSVKASND